MKILHQFIRPQFYSTCDQFFKDYEFDAWLVETINRRISLSNIWRKLDHHFALPKDQRKKLKTRARFLETGIGSVGTRGLPGHVRFLSPSTLARFICLVFPITTTPKMTQDLNFFASEASSRYLPRLVFIAGFGEGFGWPTTSSQPFAHYLTEGDVDGRIVFAGCKYIPICNIHN